MRRDSEWHLNRLLFRGFEFITVVAVFLSNYVSYAGFVGLMNETDSLPRKMCSFIFMFMVFSWGGRIIFRNSNLDAFN